jgi:hypothetical protein
MNTFETRKAEALRILGETGIWRSNYLPPATRTLWRLGFEVRPPHFISFGRTMLFLGIYFGLAWGAIMYLSSLIVLGRSVVPLPAFALVCAGAGFFFGVSMATYYAYGRRKHRLPAWETLGETEGAS